MHGLHKQRLAVLLQSEQPFTANLLPDTSRPVLLPLLPGRLCITSLAIRTYMASVSFAQVLPISVWPLLISPSRHFLNQSDAADIIYSLVDRTMCCRWTGAAAVGVCLMSFAITSLTNPGVVTKDNEDFHHALYQYDEVTSTQKDCRTCNLSRPARSKHCPICKRYADPAQGQWLYVAVWSDHTMCFCFNVYC